MIGVSNRSRELKSSRSPVESQRSRQRDHAKPPGLYAWIDATVKAPPARRPPEQELRRGEHRSAGSTPARELPPSGACPGAGVTPERDVPESGDCPTAGGTPGRGVPQGARYPTAGGTPEREVPQSGICRRAFRNRLDSESGRLLTYITAPPQQLTPRNRSHRRSSG